jgi:hypothetical protein
MTTNINFLNRDQFYAACPAAFENKAYNETSDRYKVINAQDIVQELGKYGWHVRQASQETSKKFKNKAKFLIRLANRNHEMQTRFPEIVITSSHNGKAAFRLQLGMFELVCSNGLVIARKTLAKVKINHKGDVQKKIALIMETVIEEIQKLDGVIFAMQNRILTADEQRSMAVKFLEMREIAATTESQWDMAIETSLASPTLYNPKIIGQDGDSLFDVFQRLQGNIVKGEVYYGEKKQASKLNLEIDGVENTIKELVEKLNETDVNGGRVLTIAEQNEVRKQLRKANKTLNTKNASLERVGDTRKKLTTLLQGQGPTAVPNNIMRYNKLNADMFTFAEGMLAVAESN